MCRAWFCVKNKSKMIRFRAVNVTDAENYGVVSINKWKSTRNWFMKPLAWRQWHLRRVFGWIDFNRMIWTFWKESRLTEFFFGKVDKRISPSTWQTHWLQGQQRRKFQWGNEPSLFIIRIFVKNSWKIWPSGKNLATKRKYIFPLFLHRNTEKNALPCDEKSQPVFIEFPGYNIELLPCNVSNLQKEYWIASRLRWDAIAIDWDGCAAAWRTLCEKRCTDRKTQKNPNEKEAPEERFKVEDTLNLQAISLQRYGTP